MFELASALFSIADANEFRFARFYIVCEAVPLGAPESPLIVCGLSDTSSRSVKTWPRHGRNWQKRQRRNSRILFQRILPPVFRWNVRVMPFNEQQRSDEPLSPAACLTLLQLFVLYEHLLDDLCFSKFGTFHGGCPQSADNFRTFVCVPYGHL